MAVIKLIVEYDGTDFVGWQIQKNGNTIQAELQQAVKTIFNEEAKVYGAGRTDSGVHARGQVASFTIQKNIDVEKIPYKLNAVLPKSICVLKASEESENFHARYNAISRRYLYYVSQKPTAIFRNYCWYIPFNLDIEKLNQCANAVLGIHCFKSFCRLFEDEHNYKCAIKKSSWIRDKDFLIYEVESNRFLYSMVRSLVGTMINVARGHISFEEFLYIIEEQKRTNLVLTAPAKGLFLEEVVYDEQKN